MKQQAITLETSNFTKQNWFHSLPFQRFQALLTLFSKSFSPFPHGTCLLSVSNQYLALDEIYHPIYAPIPRNATLRTHTVHGGLQMTNGTLTLIGQLFQENLHLRLRWQCISRLQFKAKGPNFQAELIPVHSPLLRESYLVSYPPLTYMLKFSGFADLTSSLGWSALGTGWQGPPHKQDNKETPRGSSSCLCEGSLCVKCVKGCTRRAL